MTAKLTQTPSPDVYSFVCPGCALTHEINTASGTLSGPEDLSAPSYVPAQTVVEPDSEVCQWLMFNGTLRFGGATTGYYRKTTMDMLDV